LKGDGLAFVHAGGTVLERQLGVGETLRVDTGCLVAFQESVDYDIQFIGGFKNVLFGGEGLFFALLKGPGKVFLQTLPFSRLADRVIKASGIQRGGTRGESRGLAGLGGGLLKDIISGD
ncbi:AIM24 family protein, partial [bacterium]|nr:AIM24 family protein [bacterium]